MSQQEGDAAGKSKNNDGKVKVQFKAVGNAPILKRNKFLIHQDKLFNDLYIFLRKNLKANENDSLFLYCNDKFAPNLDQSIKDLFECFNINNELIISYGIVECYG